MVLKRKHSVSRILATALAVAMLGCWPVLAFAEETSLPDSGTAAVTETTEPTTPDSETDQTEAGSDATTSTPADSAAAPDASLDFCWPKPDNSAKVKVTKYVKIRENTPIPNTVFQFTVKAGPKENTDGTSQPIIAGDRKCEGVSVENFGYLPFSAQTATKESDGRLSRTFNLIVHPEVFNKVGIYHYILSETSGGIEGMVYDTAPRDVYVYIINDADGNPVYGNTIIKNGKEKSYEFDNEYNTHTLSVTKNLTGNMADMSTKFEFNVKIQGQEGKVYFVKRGDGKIVTLDPGKTNTFPVDLGDDDSLTIYGLVDEDTCTVTEKHANQNGYKTTFACIDPETKNPIDCTVPNFLGTDGVSGNIKSDMTVLCTNNREGDINSGLAADVLPYAGMVLLAIGCGIYLLRRKHEEEL